MSAKQTLFVVDDDKQILSAMEMIFAQSYELESFPSAAACLQRVAEKAPDLFMLAVDLPAMDGFALCRQLHDTPSCSRVPVIMLSPRNDLDTHLCGYDAGADDFAVKPLDFPELKLKAEVLLRTRQEEANLRQQIEESEMLTSLILANLDEYAVLVKFLRSLNNCEDYRDLADVVLTMLESYHLDGVVQFRLPAFELTINHACEVKPLEASIINQVRDMGTIAEYKSRAAFNFERISVLVNNMPLHDPELCGRLRDHLAISVETADAKILAMATQQENHETRKEISTLVADLGQHIHDFREKYETARQLGAAKTQEMLTDLNSEFANLGMREVQEDSIKGLVQTRADELIEIFDFSTETERTLNDLSSRLDGRIAKSA